MKTELKTWPRLLLGLGLLVLGVNLYATKQMPGIVHMLKSPMVLESKTESVGPFFEDIVGYEAVKAELNGYLSQPSHTADIFKGFVFYGPAGTGKHMMAKAAANEADIDFEELDMNDLVFDKLGTLRNAIGSPKPKVVFINNADVFLPRDFFEHDSMLGFFEPYPLLPMKTTFGKHTSQVDKNVDVIRRLVTEKTSNILLILSARHKLSKLPEIESFLQFPFVNPDKKTRVLLFQKKLPSQASSFAQELADLTFGFNAKDISTISMLAKQQDQDETKKDPGTTTDVNDLKKIIQKIKDCKPILKDWEKQVVAFHEAGHAVVSWNLKDADKLEAVSIVPSNKALGYTQYANTRSFMLTSDQIFARICVLLAGRQAESKFTQHFTTGARDDLNRATVLAYSSVATNGFGQLLTSFDHMTPIVRVYGDEVSRQIDTQAHALLTRADDIAKDLVARNSDAVKKVANSLVEKEMLSFTDMQDLLGKTACKPTVVSMPRPCAQNPPKQITVPT